MTYKNELAKKQTGISGFDVIMKGGIPKGRATLVSGNAGSGKTIFSCQFIQKGIEQFGESCVIVTFEESPEEMKQNVAGFDWHFKDYEQQNKLAFIDASQVTEQLLASSGELDLSALQTRIQLAVDKVGADRLVIDTLSNLLSAFEDKNFIRQEFYRIVSMLKEMDVTILITSESIYADNTFSLSRYGVEEFVADNVLLLKHEKNSTKRRRTIEAYKFRGCDYLTGEYKFAFTSEGVKVFAFKNADTGLYEAKTQRLPVVNHEQINQLTHGGIFDKATTVINGPAGGGKTILSFTLVEAACMHNQKAMFFGFEEPVSQILQITRNCNMDLSSYYHNGLLNIYSDLPEVKSVEEHMDRINSAVARDKPKLIVIDSLTSLQRICNKQDALEFLINLTNMAKRYDCSCILTTSSSLIASRNDYFTDHLSTVADTIFSLQYVEVEGEIKRGMCLLKMRGSEHDQRIFEYDIDNQGICVMAPFSQAQGIFAKPAK